MKAFIRFIRALTQEISGDDLFTLAAALSYYTALSISPLLLIMLWVLQSLGLGDQQLLIREISSLIGSEAAEGISLVMENAKQYPSTGSLAGIVGLCALILSVSAVFGQLQYSFNRIWGIAPRQDIGWRAWLHKRLLSFGMVLGLGFVAVVSLVVDSILSFMSQGISAAGVPLEYLSWLESAASLIVFILIFSALFRLLPDVHLRWRDVWSGGLITALLFALGKEGIGAYLGRSSVGSAYGAAGSLVVFLVWVYYSSLIVFIGGEVTQLMTAKDPIAPGNAVPAT